MKILAIDDQKLVLLPLQKQLTSLGYTVQAETNAKKGVSTFNSFKPSLVIVDINMPEIDGLEFIKHIRKIAATPIMILSGNTKDDIIEKAFELGANDYIKKPLSLNEICVRIKHLIGLPKHHKPINNSTIIQHRCVGVVIPCYNEEKRLQSAEFLAFIKKNSGYHLCFVNDGSTDNTLKTLQEIQQGKTDFITVYNCKQNGGKAEAVRQGMLHMAKMADLDYIGFLDADLSTNLTDFDKLVNTIETTSYKIVSGSRITRMGANITKAPARQIISQTINYAIKKILGLNFKDTQCGAKIFSKDVIPIAFTNPFVTQWIFDVEIFKRITQHYGLKKAKTLLYEQPLERWVHADGSKLSFSDSLQIIFQLVKIAWMYNFKSSGNHTNYNTPINLV